MGGRDITKTRKKTRERRKERQEAENERERQSEREREKKSGKKQERGIFSGVGRPFSTVYLSTYTRCPFLFKPIMTFLAGS